VTAVTGANWYQFEELIGDAAKEVLKYTFPLSAQPNRTCQTNKPHHEYHSRTETSKMHAKTK